MAIRKGQKSVKNGDKNGTKNKKGYNNVAAKKVTRNGKSDKKTLKNGGKGNKRGQKERRHCVKKIFKKSEKKGTKSVKNYKASI